MTAQDTNALSPETGPYAYADERGRIIKADKWVASSKRVRDRYCRPLFQRDAVDVARVEGFRDGQTAAEPIGYTGSVDSAMRAAVDAMVFVYRTDLIPGSFDETADCLHDARASLANLLVVAKTITCDCAQCDIDKLTAAIARVEGRE